VLGSAKPFAMMTAADNSKKRRHSGRGDGPGTSLAPGPGSGHYFPDLRYPSAAARVRALRGA
jgi:hypothetical protein